MPIKENLAEQQFLDSINQNLGIIHKVCNIYFTNPADKQDIFQEILYQLWKSYKSFSGASKFSTWLYKVALNTAIGFVKNKKKEIPKEEIKDYHLHTQTENIHLTKSENESLLYDAIHTLSDIDKAIILLYLEDNSYDEIASITGLSKGNISVKLVRIKKSLKEKINLIP